MKEVTQLVSLIVRTKDRPKLVRNALRSISLQTYRPVEVVLVNDGGCDLDIGDLKGILGDVSLNYIRLEKSSGRARAGNTGIKNARGGYLGFLDDDDLLLPVHLSCLMSAAAEHGAAVVYSDAYLVQVDYAPETMEMTVRDRKVFSTGSFSYRDLVIDNYIPLMTILFSREILAKVGGFDEQFDLYEDWDMLIRAGEVCTFHHVTQTTAEYLQWSSAHQIAQDPESVENAVKAHVKIIRKHRHRFTADMIRGLVQTRRTLRAREEKTASLKKALREKDAVLGLIYASHGWKVLRSYYKLRDFLLPEGTGRRALAKGLIRRLSALSGSPADHNGAVASRPPGRQGTDSATVPEIPSAAAASSEGGCVLILGDWNTAGSDLAGWERNFLDSLIRLNYEVFHLGNVGEAEEYFKANGDRFSFVIGADHTICFNCSPLVRAYSPQSVLLVVARSGDVLSHAELLNASVSDGVIADSQEVKDALLQRNPELKVDVISEGEPMLLSLKEAFEGRRGERVQKEDFSEGENKKTENDGADGPLLHEERTATGYSEEAKGSVLVAGIYLADQENAIEHIVEELARSRNFQVTQRWAALCGDAPTEDVGEVTVLRSAERLPKMTLLNKLLCGVELQGYDYLLICDDDITLPDGFLDVFLGLQRRYELAAAQPARTHDSYIDHFIVEQLDGVKVRLTRFVEIGPMVSFSRDIIPFVFPFDEATPMGWGFDFVLPCIAESHGLRIGIIDETPVDHSMRKPMHNYQFDDVKKAMESYLSTRRHLTREEAFRIVGTYS